MFLTFGGAAAPSGGAFQKTDGTNVINAGPFLWDPTKADPNKVGGTTGSGWNTTNVAQGGNMWIDLEVPTATHVYGTTANTIENGKDVVYVTADHAASGFPPLYRYTLGDMRNGGQDTWEIIGLTWNTVGYQGSATIDTTHNLYIGTSQPQTLLYIRFGDMGSGQRQRCPPQSKPRHRGKSGERRWQRLRNDRVFRH